MFFPREMGNRAGYLKCDEAVVARVVCEVPIRLSHGHFQLGHRIF